MLAESSLNALVVTPDAALFKVIAEVLRRVGAGPVLQATSAQAALAEVRRKHSLPGLGVVHLDEDLGYDTDSVRALVGGGDVVLRFPAAVAVVRAQSRAFLAQIGGLGFSAIVTLPLNQTLLRLTLTKAVAVLEAEYRNPDLVLLRQAFDKGELDFVEQRCLKALRHQRGHPLLCAWLGEIYFRRGRFGDALRCTQEAARATATGQMPPDALRLLVKTLHKLGRTEEAFSEVPKLAGGQVQSPSIVLGLIPLLHTYASRQKAAGHIEEAVVCYEMALREPDARQYESQLYLNLGLAHLALGQLEVARQAAKRSAAGSSKGGTQKALDLLRYIEARLTSEEKREQTHVSKLNRAPAAEAQGMGLYGGQVQGEFEAADLGAPLDSSGRAADLLPFLAPSQRQGSVATLLEVTGRHPQQEDVPSEPLGGGTEPALTSDPVLESILEASDVGFERAWEEGEGSSPGSNMPSSGATDSSFFAVAQDSNAAGPLSSFGPGFPGSEAPSLNESSSSALGSTLDEVLGAVGGLGVASGPGYLHQGEIAEAQPERPEGGDAAGDPAAQGLDGGKDESDGDPRTLKWGLMSEDKILAFLMFEGEFPPIRVKPLKVQPSIRAEWVREVFELEDTGSDS